MASFNSIGVDKTELLLVIEAIEYAYANDGSLTAGEIADLTLIADTLTEIRNFIVAYDTANLTTTNPALTLKSAINAF